MWWNTCIYRLGLSLHFHPIQLGITTPAEAIKSLTWQHLASTLLMNSTGQHPLTLCRAQHPKMSAWGRGQNVPKRPVVISKLRWFHTKIFPYNLARISWIITVRDFDYFLLRHLHCLCIQSESERVFESWVEEMCCRFSRRVSSTIQTTKNDSMAFVVKLLCFEKL